MNVRPALSLAVAAGLVAKASAQPYITTPGITPRLDLTWQEDPVYPHNDNGVLEPGEHALVLTSLSFTGQFTRVDFTPAVGSFSSGTILGFGADYLDVRSSSQDPSGLYNGGITQWPSTSPGPNANEDGTWGYGVRGGWRAGENIANGRPVANGFQDLGPGQIPANPAAANTTNPIDRLHRLGWQPNSYAQRTVTFAVRFAFGNNTPVALYLDYDGQSGGMAYLPETQLSFGSVNIPVVPAPSTVMIMLAGCGVAARRRRREASR